MQNTSIEYIGKPSIRTLRDFILDNSISENDTVLLNQIDFDELALEYRDDYKENLVVPYYLLTVLIKEDEMNSTPVGRIKVVKHDSERFAGDYNNIKISGPSESYAYDIIYRCGWCGNVVDFDGRELEDSTKKFKISILEKFSRTVKQPSVNGECCKHRHNQ
ncbi:hypothetical protein [Pedobacter nyackensis]|uniref:Uncharacterized protein n=1 Tax=Pedobacter nyackensis TaxID=475255 RepID=A0A1W2DAH4_9SPHI|nr:hypothetical protein [Pedobacter nyackensis]SMC94471.1 hypothetical protein SAMN04488101_10689 [Pedobacter nyackensis]